jgi:hypothetical protein
MGAGIVLTGLLNEFTVVPMNKCIVYGVVTAYAITDLHHPHAHVEQVYNTDPIQMGRLVVTTTSSANSQALLIDRPYRG